MVLLGLLEPFSLLYFGKKIMVMLVSFRFSFDQFQHSRGVHLGWLNVHSFWAGLLSKGHARKSLFSPNRITSVFSCWIYIEWGTLIWRVSDSPSASSAPLKGVLHHPKHRAINFIDITSESEVQAFLRFVGIWMDYQP